MSRYPAIALAGYGFDTSTGGFSRLSENTVGHVDTQEHASAHHVIFYRDSDGARMHIQKRAIEKARE